MILSAASAFLYCVWIIRIFIHIIDPWPGTLSITDALDLRACRFPSCRRLASCPRLFCFPINIGSNEILESIGSPILGESITASKTRHAMQFLKSRKTKMHSARAYFLFRKRNRENVTDLDSCPNRHAERYRSPSSRSDLSIEKTPVRELGCIGWFGLLRSDLPQFLGDFCAVSYW